MSREPRAIGLLVAWTLCLALLGWYVQQQLNVSTDLRLFLPSPTTPSQRLLLEEIGEGPASRILVMALSGAPPEQLADVSRQLVDELSTREEFRFITNGEMSLDAVPEDLWPYRFLLSPNLDRHALDKSYLHDELQARARDLSVLQLGEGREGPDGAVARPRHPQGQGLRRH